MKAPKRIELSESEADELLGRLAQARLGPRDYEVLGAIVKSWLWLSRVVQDTTIFTFRPDLILLFSFIRLSFTRAPQLYHFLLFHRSHLFIR